VLLAVSKQFGQDQECLPRIASGLGGGLGRQGEACGALAGGVLVIGLLYGPERPHDKEAKNAVHLQAGEFVRRFAELNGALRCRDLIGMDIGSEEAVEEYYAGNLKEERCNAIVSNAVRAVLELVKESGQPGIPA
jgi:C_GCAxxG_C_C family probable redox protein